MNPELNREYPEPGEAELIEEMVKITRERMKPQQGHIRRARHAKATGCVRGVFTIRDDIANDFRHGIFQKPDQSFQAIIRFSNSSEMMAPDGSGDARGIAVKLLNVDGTPAIPGNDNHCQDFLAVNHPVFPFATPAEFVKFFDIREIPFVGDPLATAWLALFHNRHLNIAREILSETASSPLELTYWSCSPYWLGSPLTVDGRAVKYSLVPCFKGTTAPKDPNGMPGDYLNHVLKQHLKTKETVFEFRVQPQTDPVTMPIEDASIVWDEEISKPVHIATLTIGVQDLDSTEGRALTEECEKMAFSPWNALAEHRPLGGINRLRRKVYLASQTERMAKNEE